MKYRWLDLTERRDREETRFFSSTWGEEGKEEEEEKREAVDPAFNLILLFSSGHRKLKTELPWNSTGLNFLSTWPQEGTEKRLDSFPRSEEEKGKRKRKRLWIQLLPQLYFFEMTDLILFSWLERRKIKRRDSILFFAVRRRRRKKEEAVGSGSMASSKFASDFTWFL